MKFYQKQKKRKTKKVAYGNKCNTNLHQMEVNGRVVSYHYSTYISCYTSHNIPQAFNFLYDSKEIKITLSGVFFISFKGMYGTYGMIFLA